MMHNRFGWWILSLTCLLQLNACNWHLRGVGGKQPLAPVAILFTKETPWEKPLIQALQTLQTPLVEPVEPALNNETSADLVLTIKSLYIVERIVAYDSRGRAERYQLNMVLAFHARNTKTHKELANRSLTAVSEYNFDERAILGKTSERAVLEQQLVKDIAQLLRRQLLTLMP